MNESVAFLERQDTKQGFAILHAGPCSGMFFLEGSRGTAPVHMHARSEHNSMCLITGLVCGLVRYTVTHCPGCA